MGDTTKTSGEYTTEEAALEALLPWARTMGTVFTFAHGRLLQPRFGATGKRTTGVEADVLVVPSQELCEAGWTHGVIGIEVKRSGTKLGPVIAQVLDYQRAAFSLGKDARYIDVVVRHWFVFPCEPVFCNVESIMSQHGVGTAHPVLGGGVRFGLPPQRNTIEVRPSGISAQAPVSGTKAGSR